MWIEYIQSIVFSRIKSEFSEKLKTKYSMTSENFSTVGSSDAPAVFPFVYVQLLGSPESGQTTEGDSVNAGLFTFQIDVTDNKSQNNAKTVAFEILMILKGMRFEITAMPSFEDTTDTHRATIRARRMIAENDTL